MKTWISVILLVLVYFFQKGDAAITAWSLPAGGNAAVSIAENNAAAAAVATIAATSDATLGDFTLLTTDTPFALAVGGALTVSAANTLDFETTPTYVLTIQAVDSGPSTATATLTVSVTDANDAPTFCTFSTCVVDGTAASTTAYTLTATDPDASASLTYSIAGGNTAADFSIAAGGVISTANALSAARTGVYNLIIEATDGTVAATATISFTVSASCPSSATALVFSGLTMLTALVVGLH